MAIIIDIETAPDYDAVDEMFNPDKVRTGNIKDPAKIEAKLLQEKMKMIDEAALNPMTAKIVAIGVKDVLSGETAILTNDSEVELLTEATEMLREMKATVYEKVFAWNANFDKKMLVWRSWKNKVYIPHDWSLRYDKSWVCLMERFCLGIYGERVSLANASKFLGVAKEREYECNGKDFHKFLKTDKNQAMQYLLDDVEEAEAIYNIICA